MIDMKDYTYHRSHRRDDRLKVAEAYRNEAEKAELDKELNQVAEDIIESMNDTLDDVLDPVDDYSDFVDRGNR